MDYNINGFENEYEFVKYLNKKKVKELNPMFKELIEYLYPENDENEMITSWLNKYKQKTDVFIKVNGKIKGISIKKGSRNSMHCENIKGFVQFLTDNKISKETIIEYLRYHYADGTANGKGKIRLSAEEYKETKQEEIDSLNKKINTNALLTNAIYKFVIKGNNSTYIIDALVYGTVDDFLWIGTADIKKIILSRKNDYCSAVHIGPLIFQPADRCLNYNKKHESKRHEVQVKWYSLYDDIIELMYKKSMSNK